MPPAATMTRGPNVASCTSPSAISTPSTIGCTSTSTGVAPTLGLERGDCRRHCSGRRQAGADQPAVGLVHDAWVGDLDGDGEADPGGGLDGRRCAAGGLALRCETVRREQGPGLDGREPRVPVVPRSSCSAARRRADRPRTWSVGCRVCCGARPARRRTGSRGPVLDRRCDASAGRSHRDVALRVAAAPIGHQDHRDVGAGPDGPPPMRPDEGHRVGHAGGDQHHEQGVDLTGREQLGHRRSQRRQPWRRRRCRSGCWSRRRTGRAADAALLQLGARAGDHETRRRRRRRQPGPPCRRRW